MVSVLPQRYTMASSPLILTKPCLERPPRRHTSSPRLPCCVLTKAVRYFREPPCSSYDKATECSQFFHNVQIPNLAQNTTYYYQIEAANGTTESNILSFTTSRNAGSQGEFSAILLNDMGYTNAQGTYKKMLNMIETEDIAFALHGGDISYVSISRKIIRMQTLILSPG